jgi:Ca2+-dependent lipid-binding protein
MLRLLGGPSTFGQIDDCENLADVDNSFMSGTTDPFIVVECEGREETTPTFFNNANPKFNWECTFEVTEINTFLRLNFWDFDGGKLNGEDSQFGLVVIPINHLLQVRSSDEIK